jgi:hypothetical protein
MYDPAFYGTVAAWVGTTITSVSVAAAAGYYVFDRRRERRVQAGSVLVWLHPYEHGPPELKMVNLSDKPVFDHGFLITYRPRRQIAKTARDGWKQNKMFAWPEGNKFSYHDRHTLLNYHDGSELYLSPDKLVAYHPELQYNSAVHNYYAYFRDVSGQYWVVDARTQRPVSAWKRWRLRIGPAGLDAS